jgi:hypothetical protein
MKPDPPIDSPARFFRTFAENSQLQKKFLTWHRQPLVETVALARTWLCAREFPTYLSPFPDSPEFQCAATRNNCPGHLGCPRRTRPTPHPPIRRIARPTTPQLSSLFDSRATHARTLLPAAMASVPFGFVLARVRVRSPNSPALDAQRSHRVQTGLVVRGAYFRPGFSRSPRALRALDPTAALGLAAPE